MTERPTTMHTLRLVSYNIRRSVGLDWRRDPDRIQNVLDEMDADVVILQEADMRFGARTRTLPFAELTKSGYQFADFDQPSQSSGWHGNAILYRCRLEPVETTRIELPTIEPRGAVAVVFQLAEQHRLRVIGAHLSIGRSMRDKQILALVDFVEQHPVDCPTVVGGDFNDRRSDEALRQSFANKYDIVAPGPSFHSSRLLWALDRFALKGALTLQHSFVHNSTLALRASDHLPICMDVQFRSPPKPLG